ncbi:MAG: 4Fe-4S binding protein [Planctomycetes bacterium]|nr:4Fe-4S binding protein [Planctomycetota bacterium]
MEKLNAFFKHRQALFVLRLPSVAMFVFIIYAGLFGNYYRNIAPLLMGAVWLVAISVIVLFAGKLWCTFCPWDAISEWVQRVTFWRVKKAPFNMGLKWPSFLRNIHIPLLMLIVLIWAEYSFALTDDPRNVAYLSLGMLTVTFVSAMFFEKKSFCRYGCPVGAMTGIMAMFAGLNVRSVSKNVCDKCRTKDCVRGNEKGYGCPVYEYPGGMKTNLNCIVCTECVKTCPYDNMRIRTRRFSGELEAVPGLGKDVILAIAVLLALTTFSGWAKMGMYDALAEKMHAAGYSEIIVHLALFLPFLIAVPLLFYAFAYFTAAIHKVPAGKAAEKAAYALVPLVIFIHLGYIVRHFLTQAGRLVPLISDPLGTGADLFGTAGMVEMDFVPPSVYKTLSMAVMALGLMLSLRLAGRMFGETGGESKRALIFQVFFVLLVTAINVFFIIVP